MSLYLDDNMVSFIYEKRKLMHSIEKEINPLIIDIKESFIKSHMLYSSTSNFNIQLKSFYKANDNFIALLEEKNLHYLITKTCEIDNFKRACKILSLSSVYDYQDIWQRKLLITPKK